jgi:hypothetical protein
MVLFFSVSSCLAAQGTSEQGPFFRGIEILTGYGLGNTSYQGHYKVAPVFVDLNFDLKRADWLKKIFPGMLNFVVEPFASYVFSPHNNAEAGTNFLLKIGFLPETSNFQPYFKGGVGLIYISQHLREQSTQFNFNEPAAVGAHFFFRKNLALTLEYRFRHLSNSGMKSPNHGVNTNFGLCGLSYLF